MSRIWKVAGICGLATPIVAYSCIFTAIASWSQFSWVNNALSDLGVQAGATEWVFNSGLTLSGLLSLVFATGLFQLVRKRVLAQVGAVAFGLACISLTLIGVFNESFSPIHFYVSVTFFVLLPISQLILVPGFWLLGERKLTALTLVLAFAAAAPWVMLFAVRYVEGVAVPEFASSVAGVIWVVALSVKLLRVKSRVA